MCRDLTKAERGIVVGMIEENCWFISHSTKNIAIVDAIVEILISCKIPYWKAPEMIPRGSCYANEIPKAIHSCSIFLLVLSEEAQESIYVQREVDMAIGYRKKILALKIDKSILNDMFHFWLNTVQMEQVIVQNQKLLSLEMKKTLRRLFLQESGQNEPKPDVFQTTTTFERATKSIKVDTRSNALRVNKIPMQCEYCGEPLQRGVMGVYKCSRCGREYYDDFRKIKNFIEHNGPSTAWEISRGTGVSLPTIKAYFSDQSGQKTW